MKEVIKFEAFNGKIFDSKSECLQYENLLNEIKKAMGYLKPCGSHPGFNDGECYIQQNKTNIVKAMHKIVELSGIEKSPEFINDAFNCRFGIIGRIICDSDNIPLWNAWQRFMCIDHLGREWVQPYYAKHPNFHAKEINF